jgi:hypothetical protein
MSLRKRNQKAIMAVTGPRQGGCGAVEALAVGVTNLSLR